MTKKYLFVLLFFILSGCSQSPEEAKSELQRLGYPYSPEGIYTAVYQGNDRAVELFNVVGISGKMFEYAIAALSRDKYFRSRPPLNTKGVHLKDDVILSTVLSSPIAEQYKKNVPNAPSEHNILRDYAYILISSMYYDGPIKAQRMMLDKTYKILAENWGNINAFCLPVPYSKQDIDTFKKVLSELDISLDQRDATSIFTYYFKPLGGGSYTEPYVNIKSDVISFFLNKIDTKNEKVKEIFELFVKGSERKLLEVLEKIQYIKQQNLMAVEAIEEGKKRLSLLREKKNGYYVNYAISQRIRDKRIKDSIYRLNVAKENISNGKLELERLNKEKLQEISKLDQILPSLIDKCKCLSSEFLKKDSYFKLKEQKGDAMKFPQEKGDATL